MTNEDLAFQAQVREFIDQHWPERVRQRQAQAVARGGRRSPEERAWFDALLARGWSVPGWPVEHGGTAWTPTALFIWERETALVEAPRPAGCGARVLGPLLCQFGDHAQRERFLPPIREARVHWCLGSSDTADPGVVADVHQQEDHYLVNAETMALGAVRAGEAPDWMLCPAGVGDHAAAGVLLIDMTSRGVRLHPEDSADAPRRVSLTRV